MVGALDDPAGLGEPDVALDRAQQRLRAARAEAVGVDVVVQAPDHAALADRLLERLDPLRQLRAVEEVGGDDPAAVAVLAQREVVLRRALGLWHVGWLQWLASFHVR